MASQNKFPFPKASAGHSDASATDLSLTVVFTTVPATLAALREAADLARQLNAQIQILVPYVVPYPLPLDCPPVDVDFRMRQFHTLCEQARIETRIDIRLCRSARECLLQELAPYSVVLIGNDRWGPFTDWKRLAQVLEHGGHHVLVVRRNPSVAVGLHPASRSPWATYSQRRFITFVLFFTANLLFALVSALQHRYPIGLAAEFFLLPVLLRELDLKKGRPPHKLGPFEWSCLLAGILFLIILPILLF